MAFKEKGRPAGGDPIPNTLVCQDNSEFKPQLIKLQAFNLARRCAIDAAMAEALAPMVFGVLS